MSDTHGRFDLTYLEPAVDKVKDVAAWTYTHVQEVTDAIDELATTTSLVGNFTGTTTSGEWDYDVELHQFLNVVQIAGTVTRAGSNLTLGTDGNTYSLVFLDTTPPPPVAPTALASGGGGSYRSANWFLDNAGGVLRLYLMRAQDIGNITVGESLAFGGTYLTAGPA